MEICVTWWGWIALTLIVIFNVGLIGGLCLVLWQTYKNAQQDAIRITAFIGFMVAVLVIIGASLIAIFALFTFPAYTTNESYVGEPENYMYGIDKWSGSRAVRDCSDFDTQESAQRFLETFLGPSLDRHILDPDEDKIACNHQDHHNMTE